MKRIIFLIGSFFSVYFFAEQKELNLINNSKKRIMIRYKTQLDDETEKYVTTLPIESGTIAKTDLILVSSEVKVMILRGKKIFLSIICT